MTKTIHPLLLAATIAGATPATGQSEYRVQFDTFAIDQTEVTVGQFRAFAEKTGLVTAAERDGGGFEFGAGWERRPGWTYLMPYGELAADDEPAVHISHGEAAAYCRDAGGRLPTFAEWQSAAYTEQRSTPAAGFEAGRTYDYPVGDSPEGMNNSRERHVAVGTTKEGINGLYDMGANVWEWLADRQGDDALTAGGSWWYGPDKARAEAAQWKPADFYALYVGFRCVYETLEP
jgi:formylglycine-generating enzyme